MDRYVPVSEARQRFLQLVDDTLEGDQIIVTKRGTPAVVLIDFERLETLKCLAQLWQDPGRAPSFYDPQVPSYLYRAGSFLVHYRLTDDDKVEFFNLFH